jgi:hypothetical protein
VALGDLAVVVTRNPGHGAVTCFVARFYEDYKNSLLEKIKVLEGWRRR